MAKLSLIEKMAEKYAVDPKKFYEALQKAAFNLTVTNAPGKNHVTESEMLALLVVADSYGLNPFTKEIYAFRSKDGVIRPIVSIDGWIRIMNENPQYDGIEFRYSETMIVMPGAKSAPEWVEAIIYRKDRRQPTVAREYLDEAFRSTDPWRGTTKRMLRHRATVQGARLAFGFSGIYEHDEIERMDGGEIAVDSDPVLTVKPALTSDEMNQLLPKLQNQLKVLGWESVNNYLGSNFNADDVDLIQSVLKNEQAVVEMISTGERVERDEISHDYAEIPV